MLRIDLHGYRLASDERNITLCRLVAAKQDGKHHKEGDILETGMRFYPNVESAVKELVSRLAIGGDAVVVEDLATYLRRLNEFWKEVTSTLEPGFKEESDD